MDDIALFHGEVRMAMDPDSEGVGRQALPALGVQVSGEAAAHCDLDEIAEFLKGAEGWQADCLAFIANRSSEAPDATRQLTAASENGQEHKKAAALWGWPRAQPHPTDRPTAFTPTILRIAF